MENNKLKKLLLTAVLLLGVVDISALAAEDPNGFVAGANTIAVESKNNPLTFNNYSGDTKQIYFKLISAIVIIAVLAWLTVWLSKKVKQKSTGKSGRKIEVLETAYLATRKTLHLVKVGKKTILIGSTNDSISKLAELDDGNNFAEVLEKQEVQ